MAWATSLHTSIIDTVVPRPRGHRTHTAMALSISVPIAYIVTLFASLALFSKFYRARTQRRSIKFQEAASEDVDVQPDRAIYQALSNVQEEYPDLPANAEEWIVPRHLLQASLLARAVAALRRMSSLREDKQALQSLLDRGSLGDDAATMLEAKENETRNEAFDIARQAGRFNPNWSKLIFENANQISINLTFRDVLLNISKQREEEVAKMRQMGMDPPKLKFAAMPKPE